MLGTGFSMTKEFVLRSSSMADLSYGGVFDGTLIAWIGCSKRRLKIGEAIGRIRKSAPGPILYLSGCPGFSKQVLADALTKVTLGDGLWTQRSHSAVDHPEGRKGIPR